MPRRNCSILKWRSRKSNVSLPRLGESVPDSYGIGSGSASSSSKSKEQQLYSCRHLINLIFPNPHDTTTPHADDDAFPKDFPHQKNSRKGRAAKQANPPMVPP
ncbi:hypothetical protein Hypma_002561 [Hypsizygus marmoreus]|uniref:Uncharacterized protein n=1 Tax=Hypsizygus marmoreus TaxID=39966 RepID=A0A369J706_HYPMA|nr:hypothetical protein Hypma_002561 [Hypsizygus marmoreus]